MVLDFLKKLVKFSPVILVLLSVSHVSAQNLPRVYLEPPRGEFAPGSTISIGIFVDAPEAINALDLNLSFPATKLEFVGSDNSGSIVDIWQTKPVATGGSIPISAGIIKSFAGTHGNIIKFSFKLRAAGEANLSFSKADLYLANGEGTEVKAETNESTIYIKEGAPVSTSTLTPFESTPTDKLIKAELEKIKENPREVPRTNKPLAIIILILIFVAIFELVRYNKHRLK